MQRIRAALNTLSFSLLLVGIGNLNADAQPSETWVEPALGTYQSQIWSGGDLLLGTTEFSQTDSGSLEGSYTMNESGETVPGRLSQCEAVQLRVMRCVWNDIYGVGSLEVRFSEDFSQFSGYWGEGSQKPEFAWNGSREEAQ